jgi:hypothetical protein
MLKVAYDTIEVSSYYASPPALLFEIIQQKYPNKQLACAGFKISECTQIDDQFAPGN